MIDMKNLDKPLLFLALAICVIGLFCLYSASYNRGPDAAGSLVARQATWIAIGLVLIVPVVLFVDYQRFIDLGHLLYFAGLLLLFLVLFMGHARLGSQRWLSIGGFNLQPSEFSKIIYILIMTSYLGGRRTEIVNCRSLAMPLLLTALPFLLILLQPDLGTALILVPILIAMLFVAGAQTKHLFGLGMCGILLSPLFWNFLKGYQKERLLVFLNPDMDPLGTGYTIIQSKIAIGSGGFFGKGWLAGTQSQLNFLPERHTDFIFSVVGEEWGFFGAALLITVYFLLFRRGLVIAAGTRNMYGKLLATGLITMLGVQVFVNIAMTMGFMPVVGLPLPFMSYGGSSLWTSLIAIGLLLNVGMRRTRF